MNGERIAYSPRVREADFAKLEELRSIAEQAYKETYAEWERAKEQADKWHRYEQRLVHERNAMETALVHLRTAIDLAKDASNERGSFSTQQE